MIVAFFGHSGFSEEEKYKQRLLDLFDEHFSGEQVDFYLGYYGRFDRFAYSCAKKYKEKHPNANLILVTPYFNETTHSVLKPDYDLIFYPELESVPPKYRIIKRNEWTARAADLIITYVTHTFGGAYKAYSYAKKKGKKIINLYEQ